MHRIIRIGDFNPVQRRLRSEGYAQRNFVAEEEKRAQSPPTSSLFSSPVLSSAALIGFEHQNSQQALLPLSVSFGVAPGSRASERPAPLQSSLLPCGQGHVCIASLDTAPNTARSLSSSLFNTVRVLIPARLYLRSCVSQEPVPSYRWLP
jgi:hypothetical protein